MIFDYKTTIIAAGAALAIGAVIGAAGAWDARGWQADRDLSDLRSTYDRAYAASSELARAKESELQTIADQLRARVPDEDAKTHADLASADDSAVRLRDTAAAYAAAASCDTSAEQRGKTATKAAMVLTDLFEECRAAKQQVEATADDSYNRALRCEAQYDRVRDATLKQ
ncbi:MAG: DUF2514 family protein [Pseudomonas sp.]